MEMKSLREWYEAKVLNYETTNDTAKLFILKQVYHATIQQFIHQSCYGYDHTEQQKIHYGEYHLNLLFRQFGIAS